MPEVDNANPADRAPRVRSAKVGAQANVIHLEVESRLPLSILRASLEATDGAEPISQIAYREELATSMDLRFERRRLPVGLTRVMEIMLVDKVGNVGLLKAAPGDLTYSHYESGRLPEPTSIGVMSLMGGSQ